MDIYHPEVPTQGDGVNADQAPQNPGADTNIEDNGNLGVNQAVGKTTEQLYADGVVNAKDEIYTEEHPSNPGETASITYTSAKRGPLKVVAVSTAGLALAGAVGLGWFLGRDNDSDKSAINSPDNAVERTIETTTTIPETTTTKAEVKKEASVPKLIKGNDPLDIIAQLDEAETNFFMTANPQYFTYTHDMDSGNNEENFKVGYKDALNNVQYIKDHPDKDYRVEILRFNITIDAFDKDKGILKFTAQYEMRQYDESLPEDGRVGTDSVSVDELRRYPDGSWKRINGYDIVDDSYSYKSKN